ncbi:transporter substrate-binding domain-containing protein [Marinobacterium sp. YM272]|uniref:transporter substrate-binding domain-containing protein n=1 Tax=Marinobacterium sp. YM272 TaxID=3421654 RepID=UPI003D7F41B0
MAKKLRFPKRMLPPLILGSLITSLSAEPLVIATEGTYPPFSYTDERGELTGFDVDIAWALCERMQRDCEMVEAEWTQLLPLLESGKADFVVASMAKTAERDLRVDFTDYYYRSHTIFIGDPKRFTASTPSALAGAVLTTGRGTIQADFLNKHYTNSEIRLTDDQVQALELLTSGQADLVLSDTINLLDFLQQPESSQYDFIGAPLNSEELLSKAHIAVRQGDDDLREALNSALERLRLDGGYDRINRKYFPFSIY